MDRGKEIKGSVQQPPFNPAYNHRPIIRPIVPQPMGINSNPFWVDLGHQLRPRTEGIPTPTPTPTQREYLHVSIPTSPPVGTPGPVKTILVQGLGIGMGFCHFNNSSIIVLRL